MTGQFSSGGIIGALTAWQLYAAAGEETGLIGKPATFWIYAFVGLLATVFIWLRVPETKGRSLEQIEEAVHGRPEQVYGRPEQADGRPEQAA